MNLIFSERRIESTTPQDLGRAHHIRGYLLQVRLATDVLDTKRAHWHAAQQGATQQQTTQRQPEHPPFRQRFVARVTPALDVGPAGGQPGNRQWLFQILGTMPPESRLRLVKELELFAKAKLE